ncbi:MAG: Fe-S protein assembly chaperone HscA [Magnetococcales bacterium]|nr:Fe-S protein assembly chaperone HscA [Magnetococcales bacterium]
MDILFDIAEPGQSHRPHQEDATERRRVAGIDLGTTYSLVAAIDQQGQPACMADEEGRCAVPSVVCYPASSPTPLAPLVGYAACEQALRHPERTIASVKRLMGRGLDDIRSEPLSWSCPLSSSEGGMVTLQIGERSLSPVELSAQILTTLVQRAEQALGGRLYGAVVTVPAYFDDAQRQATRDACRLADINLLRLVNEPTAAALAYGLDRGHEGVYAIYDLGGGTFDISILKLHQGVFQVLATGGNSALGGDDFDQRLVTLFMDEMAQQQPALDRDDAELLHRLRNEARRVKEALTRHDQATTTLDYQGQLYQRLVTVAELESMVDDLIRSTGVTCRRALKDAGVKPADLQGVVLVGGSTRMPAVRRYVAQLFEREPLCDLDPDQIVALGAAWQADLLAGNRHGTSGDLLLLDVTPLSLGIETMGGLVEKILPRNTPIPAGRAQEFTTFKDGQTAMAIHVVQGERETVAQCRSLARFELRGIPAMTAGAARIRVTFQVDSDGLLTVTAQEQTTAIEQTVTVKPSYGLTESEVATMLREAQQHGAEDLQQRQLQESRVESERLLQVVRAALGSDGDLLDEPERHQLDQVMSHLSNCIAGDDHEAIRQAMTALDQATQPLAQRRMDRTIQTAMTGRRTEQFI